jgi:RNA polymerase sigma factor (sigma-70 family)
MSAVMDGTVNPQALNTAFVELFLGEYERLLKYFGARINQRDEAQDLAHEVYLRLVEIPADRVIDSARGYLWAVAKSVLCRFLERSGRSVPLDVDDPVFESMLAEDPQGDTDIDREVHIAALRKYYGLLPVKCRAVMELKWFHELSYEEVAERSGVSVHMVHKHLKKGLKVLRQRMEQLDA